MKYITHLRRSAIIDVVEANLESKNLLHQILIRVP
jgi:hypothetical protein